MNIPNGTIGISIDDSSYYIQVDPDEETISVYDDRNGSVYDIEELAGFSDE